MRTRLLFAAAAASVAATGAPVHAFPPDCHGIALTDAHGDQYLVAPDAPAVVRPTAEVDVWDAYLTGSVWFEQFNVRTGGMFSSPNIAYRVRFDDPAAAGAQWELVAYFPTAPNSLNADNRVPVTVYHYPAPGAAPDRTLTSDAARFPREANVEFYVPVAGFWPTTFTNLTVTAEQFEANVFTPGPDGDVPPALRRDEGFVASWTNTVVPGQASTC